MLKESSKTKVCWQEKAFCQNTLIASVMVNWIWISSYGISSYCCTHDRDSVTPATPAMSLLIFNTPTSLSVLVKLCHTVQDSKDPVCLSFSTWLSTAPSHSFLPSFIDLFFLFSNPHYIQRFSHRNSLLLGKNPARFSPACPAWDSKNCPGDVTCWK